MIVRAIARAAAVAVVVVVVVVAVIVMTAMHPLRAARGSRTKVRRVDARKKKMGWLHSCRRVPY